MSSKWRRFEVLLPLQFNDAREVPPEWLAEAVLEIVEQFGAASHETQRVEGHWRNAGVVYRDNLVRLVVDVPDTARNRAWMKAFKQRWKAKLDIQSALFFAYIAVATAISIIVSRLLLRLDLRKLHRIASPLPLSVFYADLAAKFSVTTLRFGFFGCIIFVIGGALMVVSGFPNAAMGWVEIAIFSPCAVAWGYMLSLK